MVTINPLPSVSFTTFPSATVCAGTSVALSGTGASTYAWSGGITNAVPFIANSTNTYTVTGTNANGCTNTSSATVNVNPLPIVSGSSSAMILCLSDAAASLTGTPLGGTWSGPGISGTFFNPISAGTGTHTITYAYTDTNGCSGNANVSIQVNACVGLAENILANGVSVYPNPNNGSFILSVSANVGDLTIKITDMQGRVVYTSVENNVTAGFVKQISLDTQSSGMYLMHIITNGEQQTKKISVQK